MPVVQVPVVESHVPAAPGATQCILAHAAGHEETVVAAVVLGQNGVPATEGHQKIK